MHYDCTRGLISGVGSGIGSYFKGVFYDLPKHALAVNGFLGEASRTEALAGERAVIDAIKLIHNDPQQAMKIACIACMNLSPEQESNLQGRLGARLATAGIISTLSGPVGATASVGAITGNLLNAGVNMNSQSDVLRAILFGDVR